MQAEASSMTEAERNVEEAQNGWTPFHKIVLTGGPCGGKTTALARLSSFLRERGFEVISCPEVYTILASNGLSSGFYTTEGIGEVIQNAVLDVQISLEDSLSNVLKARGKPAVLLCDRGPMDGKAYLSDEKWNKILESRGLSEVDLRDTRYNAVYHMVSAADGAREFYQLDNNTARSESPEEACILDKQTQRCWLGHPHMYVLDNSTDFETKLQRLVNLVAKLVGLPTDLSRRSVKFLLRSKPRAENFPNTINYHVFEVEKVYLLVQDDPGDGSYRFIRKRTIVTREGERKGTVYQLTEARRSGRGELVELKRIITAREYSASYKSRDLSRHIVRQERICFLYEHQSFTVHIYENPAPGLCILHAQVESTRDEKQVVKLPDFLDVERTLVGPDDAMKYGSYALAVIDGASEKNLISPFLSS
ncbi:AAA domain containing protein [Nitzschia inconspicua]|uniref:AAA domain containing protein n=1 Tax=Nitzschia inconspicua TaxID=303405 RepID=A0A9K3KHZ1_9STRA|nr:AAA domain containing protein [Nitzschia inconspicua]